MVQWVISLFLTEDPLSYFLFQPVLYNYCNRDHGPLLLSGGGGVYNEVAVAGFLSS